MIGSGEIYHKAPFGFQIHDGSSIRCTPCHQHTFGIECANTSLFNAVCHIPACGRLHTKIPAKKILTAAKEIQKQRAVLRRAKPASDSGIILAAELDLAARMATASCNFMLWQQTVAAGNKSAAKTLAQQGLQELRKLEQDFKAYWPQRNKATPRHCTPFLRWRMEDYRRGYVA